MWARFKTWLQDADKFLVLVSIYAATYAFSPVLSGGRDINFFGYPLMPGSLMLIFNTSIISLIQDNYGKDTARKLVFGGISGRLFVWTFTLLSMMLPTLNQVPGYEKIVLSGARILLAGITARYVGQVLIDIPMFGWLRSHSRSFASAYAISMLVNVFVERAIFVVVAKAGTPGLFNRFLAHTTISLLFIAILTPIVAWLNATLFGKEIS